MQIRSLVALIITMVLTSALAAQVVAADALPVGYVDIPAVFQDYEKTKTSNTDLEAFSKQLIQKLQTLTENKLLAENERKELSDLAVKPNATDQDKARIKELQDREKALDLELKDLQNKKEPTEQEKARLKELQDKSSKADEEITKLRESSEQQFEDKKEEMSQQIRDDILKAIDAVAKQKNLNMVVDKMAVLFGGTDITQDVLAQLNGKKK
ncbi:MAG: OmpH family outer membrane protein [Armatimonadetes bacterium]|nr:OmpH family outer membrane protein [Armatimonadota bacterium]